MPNITIYANKENYEMYNRLKIRYGTKVSEYVFAVIKRDIEAQETGQVTNTQTEQANSAYAMYDIYFGDIDREYTSDSQFLSLIPNANSAIMARFTAVHANNPKLYYDVMQVFIKKHPSISRVVKIEIPSEVKVCQIE